MYFPRLGNIAREAFTQFNKLPTAQRTTKITGDIISDSLEALTSLPLAVARALGSGQDLPQPIISNKNNLDLASVAADFRAGSGNEDAVLTIEELIQKYGYKFQRHQVVTEDGYVLTLFRIPSNGSVVFLMHGLIASSDDFVTAGPESGLAYLLAKEGFDVWMGNARGNKHSRHHIDLVPSQAQFWKFSWHEIGYYDLPAMIDYILNVTGKTTLKYVGHSQGTTIFFVMASEKPEYNAKVDIMVALSPVAFMSHTKSPVVRLLAVGTGPLHAIAKTVGIYEVFADTQFSRSLKRLMCGYGPVSELLCTNPILLVVGFSFVHLNTTNLPVVYGHTPCGSSVKQFAHFGQGVLSGEFRQYDYGAVENLKMYGSKTPPEYKLENINTPVALFYSDADWLAQPADVAKLYAELGNVIDTYQVPYDMFNHMDFLLATDFKKIIYNRLRQLLNET
ncbi:lipase 3-like [Pectinophora gossypiella]|uniref:lipase 3-like n=1 Tax=Pectinophora gossypiella TaxID=13191 RepID=UPI00214DF576|nr:lipase 3-like [Pectinophora gossypiella]